MEMGDGMRGGEEVSFFLISDPVTQPDIHMVKTSSICVSHLHNYVTTYRHIKRRESQARWRSVRDRRLIG